MILSRALSRAASTCCPRNQKTHVVGYSSSSLVHLSSFKCHASENDPDWDTEMSIFKKRTLKPNQLEALRKLEEDSVSSGKVGGI